jgi:hypothetical protein
MADRPEHLNPAAANSVNCPRRSSPAHLGRDRRLESTKLNEPIIDPQLPPPVPLCSWSHRGEACLHQFESELANTARYVCAPRGGVEPRQELVAGSMLRSQLESESETGNGGSITVPALCIKCFTRISRLKPLTAPATGPCTEFTGSAFSSHGHQRWRIRLSWIAGGGWLPSRGVRGDGYAVFRTAKGKRDNSIIHDSNGMEMG